MEISSNPFTPHRRSSVCFFVDTNALGRRMSFKLLQDLKILVESGAEVYVPDVVCMELASHELEESIKAYNRLKKLGLVPQGELTRQTVENNIRKHVAETGAKVLYTPPSMYVEGIQAQIYTESPAKPKTNPGNPEDRVTTGAVDYIIFAHARNHAENGGISCVITDDTVLTTSVMQIPNAMHAKHIKSAGPLLHAHTLGKSELINIFSFVTSKRFEDQIRHELPDILSFQVAGITQATRIKDDTINATVVLLASHAMEELINSKGERKDSVSTSRDVEYYSINIDPEISALTLLGKTDSAPFTKWDEEVIDDFADFLSFELSMIPFATRPMESHNEDVKQTGFNYVLKEGSLVVRNELEPIVRAEWEDHTYVSSHETEDGDFYFERNQVEIIITAGDWVQKEPQKGSIFRAIADYAKRYPERVQLRQIDAT